MPKKEWDLKEIENLAAQGMNQRQIAESLDVNANTFVSTLANRPDVRDAYRRGKAACSAKSEGGGNGLEQSNETPSTTLTAIQQGARTIYEIARATGNAIPDVIEEIDSLVEAGQVERKTDNGLTEYHPANRRVPPVAQYPGAIGSSVVDDASEDVKQPPKRKYERRTTKASAKKPKKQKAVRVKKEVVVEAKPVVSDISLLEEAKARIETKYHADIAVINRAIEILSEQKQVT